MTLTTEVDRTQTTGNGFDVIFDYNFKIWAEDEIEVIRSNKVAPLAKQTLTITTDYTVQGVGEATGGTITLQNAQAASPPLSTENITVLRKLPYNQEVGITNQGGFKGNTLEKRYDYVVGLCQQLWGTVQRCLQVDEVSMTDPEDVTLESFAGAAPVDDSGFGGVLSGVSPATVQGCLDKIDTDAALATLAADLELRTPTLLDYAMVSGAANIAVYSADVDNHDRLMIEIFNLYGSVAAIPRMQYVDSSGTPIVPAGFGHMGLGYDSNGSEVRWNSAGAGGYAELSGGNIRSGPIRPAHGVLYIAFFTAGDWASYHGQIRWMQPSGGYEVVATIGGRHDTPPPTQTAGIQLAMSAGTITAKLRLWGLPKGS